MNTAVHITMQPVKSSQVSSAGYDAVTKTLAVKFKSGGSYHYSGVPQSAFDSLMKAESFGKHLGTNIKGVYPFKKLGA